MQNDEQPKNEPKKVVEQLLEPYRCITCRKRVGINELYGAFGMCSTCLATEGYDEHDGG